MIKSVTFAILISVKWVAPSNAWKLRSFYAILVLILRNDRMLYHTPLYAGSLAWSCLQKSPSALKSWTTDVLHVNKHNTQQDSNSKDTSKKGFT